MQWDLAHLCILMLRTELLSFFLHYEMHTVHLCIRTEFSDSCWNSYHLLLVFAVRWFLVCMKIKLSRCSFTQWMAERELCNTWVEKTFIGWVQMLKACLCGQTTGLKWPNNALYNPTGFHGNVLCFHSDCSHAYTSLQSLNAFRAKYNTT